MTLGRVSGSIPNLLSATPPHVLSELSCHLDIVHTSILFQLGMGANFIALPGGCEHFWPHNPLRSSTKDSFRWTIFIRVI